MKVLIVIASFGRTNEKYLQRLLQEYRSMPFEVHVVVLSNIPKELGSDVEVRVGQPYKNPYAFPFLHKKILAERVNDYDLFIYSEDDTLITERNLQAFLEATEVLPENEIAGFLNTEVGPNGTVYFCNVNLHFHWDPSSVRNRGKYTTAYFNNEHSASFVLTQKHLRRAIESGGFLVEPHEGRYQLRETAATDPYTQCGLQKRICVSHLDDFLIRHLPGVKFAGRPFASKPEFSKLIQALLQLEKNGLPRELLFEPETKMLHAKWSKDYYEPCRADMIALLPSNARSVLSLGCGFGYTEEALVKKGIRVVGVPMDAVIGACAEDKGVEVVYGDFRTAREKLAAERFDGILLSKVLHLVPNPAGVLASFAPLLAPEGRLVASAPNFRQLLVQWRRLRGYEQYKDLGDYEKTGIHLTTHGVVRKWFRESGLAVIKTVDILPEKAQLPYRLSLGLAGPLLARELIVSGARR